MKRTIAMGRRRSDEDIVRLVRSAALGDAEAWGALTSEFGAMIWAVARAHRLRDADAADVAQVTWLRLVEHLTDLHEPSRVGAWLATTARRECLRVLRGERGEVPLDDDAGEQPTEPPPEAGLLVAERNRALWGAFNRLRASDQALLRLLMVDPRPGYKEISTALKLPMGSIGPTRARGLERLRRELDDAGTLSLMAA
jgi:RNA polymerase sigma factor (sigma-70 family)